MFQNRFEIRMIGSVLILLSSIWIGMIRMKKLRMRPKALRDLADALTVVMHSSCFQMSPLTNAFTAAEESSDYCSAFFHCLYFGLETHAPLASLWTEAVRSLRFLSAQESQMLTALKNTLGCADADLQRSELEECIAYLRQSAEEARIAAISGSKTALGLSAVGGLMLVVLLF